MAVPVRFAVDLLRRAGWKSPEELKQEAEQTGQTAGAASNSNTVAQGKEKP